MTDVLKGILSNFDIYVYYDFFQRLLLAISESYDQSNTQTSRSMNIIISSNALMFRSCPLLALSEEYNQLNSSFYCRIHLNKKVFITELYLSEHLLKC